MLVGIVKIENFNLNHRNKGKKKRKDRKPTRHAIVNMLTQVQLNVDELVESALYKSRGRGKRK